MGEASMGDGVEARYGPLVSTFLTPSTRQNSPTSARHGPVADMLKGAGTESVPIYE